MWKRQHNAANEVSVCVIGLFASRKHLCVRQNSPFFLEDIGIKRRFEDWAREFW